MAANAQLKFGPASGSIAKIMRPPLPDTPLELDSIPEVATQHWEQYRSPLLLALLGEQLSRETRSYVKTHFRNLGDCIVRVFSGTIRLIRIPGHDLAAAPTAATSEFSDDDLVRSFQQAKPSGSSSRKSYAKAVWRGFFRPVGETPRFIEVPENGEPVLHDNSPPEGAVSNWFEVVSDDLSEIQPGVGPARANSIEQAILKWAAKHSIPPSRLESERTEKTYSRTEAVSRSGGILELQRALGVFEPSELARISIPGDVLLSLIKRLS